MPRKFDVSTPSDSSLDRPLVVILAWLGAKSRHASAYARLLAGHDVQTVTVLGDPQDIIMGRLWNIKALAHRVLEFLKSEFPRREIVIAPFSNGGGYVYEYMRVAMRDDPSAINLRGVVFDSSPARITSDSGATAVSKLYPAGSTAGTIAYWLSYALFAVLIGVSNRAETFRRRMATFDAVCPELFVYSHDDTITDPKWLEGVAGERAALPGADVRLARFVGSEHVLHMRSHPEAYAQVWRAFFADKLGHELPVPGKETVRDKAGADPDPLDDGYAEEDDEAGLVCVVRDL